MLGQSEGPWPWPLMLFPPNTSRHRRPAANATHHMPPSRTAETPVPALGKPSERAPSLAHVAEGRKAWLCCIVDLGMCAKVRLAKELAVSAGTPLFPSLPNSPDRLQDDFWCSSPHSFRPTATGPSHVGMQQ